TRRRASPSARCSPPASAVGGSSARCSKTKLPPFTRGLGTRDPHPAVLSDGRALPSPTGGEGAVGRTCSRHAPRQRELEGSSAFPRPGWVRGPARCDHLFGRPHTRVPAAVSGREIVHRAGFAGKEQTAADWRGEVRPTVGKSRRRVRIRTDRKRISAPAMNGNRPDARRKCVAEKTDEVRHGAIKKSV